MQQKIVEKLFAKNVFHAHFADLTALMHAQTENDDAMNARVWMQ